jgi:hypothetical protein
VAGSGRTLPFTARPARLADRAVLAIAVTGPKLAVALIAKLTAEYEPSYHITRRELAKSRQIPMLSLSLVCIPVVRHFDGMRSDCRYGEGVTLKIPSRVSPAESNL